MFGTAAQSPADAFDRSVIDFISPVGIAWGRNRIDIFENFGMHESAFFARTFDLLENELGCVAHRLRQ
ncbi:hypothetical protein [Mycolicibacterium sp.]|uniref:hypothetical protein n=1 Tax=Mycolicibacterium sp. TaxID=2320850 RepID=UPI0037C6243C